MILLAEILRFGALPLGSGFIRSINVGFFVLFLMAVRLELHFYLIVEGDYEFSLYDVVLADLVSEYDSLCAVDCLL